MAVERHNHGGEEELPMGMMENTYRGSGGKHIR